MTKESPGLWTPWCKSAGIEVIKEERKIVLVSIQNCSLMSAIKHHREMIHALFTQLVGP